MTKLFDKFGVWFIAAALAVMSFSAMHTSRISSDTKSLSEQNQTFLTNFSDYMRCLVVTDKEHFDRVGKEAYFDYCDQLLFRNTDLVPNSRPVHTATP